MLNPPLRSEDEMDTVTVGRPRRRDWLGRRMIAVLVMTFGSTTLLSGTDLAIIATLKEAGQVSWAAAVVVVLGVASVTGGLTYGALRRPLPTWLLLGSLGVAIIPAGLAHDWPWLCIAGVGAGLLTAPTLSTLAEAVTRMAPASARGEASGLLSSAASAGFALGSPIVGMAIDVSAPAGGFAAAGLAGLAAALTGGVLSRRLPARTRSPLNDLDLARAPDLEPCGAGTRPGALILQTVPSTTPEGSVSPVDCRSSRMRR